MMTKLLEYPSMNTSGEPGADIIRPRDFRTKMASVRMLPEMADYWRSQNPESDKYLYLLINIMGAFEYWGLNLNGDAFREQMLKKYHKTFMHGHSYWLHDNDDVKKAFGKIMFASYNDDMHRVELIARLNRSDGRTQKIETKIEANIFPEVSMGIHVPYDVCFAAGTMVQTASGNVAIDSLDGSELVITKDGHVRSIEATSRTIYTGDMLTVRAQGILDFECTANHPVFIIKREDVKSCLGSANGQKRRHTPDGAVCSHCDRPLDWTIHQVDADQIRPGDYLVSGLYQGRDEANPQLAYLMGVYAGDGCILRQRSGRKKDGPYKDMGISISCNESDPHIPAVCDIIDSMCDNDAQVYSAGCERKAVAVVVYDQALARELRSRIGHGCKDKRLRSGIMSSQEARLSFVAGCLDSDGHQDPATGLMRFVSTNKALALDVWQTCIASQLPASIREGSTCSGYSKEDIQVFVVSIPGSCSKQLAPYSHKVTDVGRRGGSRICFWNGRALFKVEGITAREVEGMPVYNIDVDGDDESYIAHGAAVHNCLICENRAKTKQDYCDHVLKHMRQLWPIGQSDGRRVGVDNPHGTFFDSSHVDVPADPQSGVLAKIASADDRPYALSVDAAVKFGMVDEEDNGSDMEKPLDPTEQPKDVPKVEYNEEARRVAKALDDSDPSIPKVALDKLSYYDPEEVIHSAASMGIAIRPNEYYYMVSKQAGAIGLADAVYLMRFERPSIDAERRESQTKIAHEIRVNREVVNILEGCMASRSFFPSSFEARTTKEAGKKIATTDNDVLAGYKCAVNDAMALLSADPSIFYKKARVQGFAKTAARRGEDDMRREASLVIEMLNGAFGRESSL